MIKLTEIPSQKRFRILELQLEPDSRRRLNTMGVHTNDFFVRENESSWGPVLIKNIGSNTSKIALGRNLADKIIVESDMI